MKEKERLLFGTRHWRSSLSPFKSFSRIYGQSRIQGQILDSLMSLLCGLPASGARSIKTILENFPERPPRSLLFLRRYRTARLHERQRAVTVYS